MPNITYFDSPIGRITVAEEGGMIMRLFFETTAIPDGFVEAETPVLREAVKQLNEYFAGGRKSFDLPLEMRGTEFQKKAWNALCAIPYGETRSYAQVAESIGNPKGTRAVGLANNRNPLAIFVPCHRVIGKNGSLTGFAGGLDAKQWLLDLEKGAAK